LSAPVFDPASAMNPPAPSVITIAITEERGCVTTAAKRPHAAIPER
jgi:hypothetical protein